MRTGIFLFIGAGLVVGVAMPAVAELAVVQNGLDGYADQRNDAISYGGWGYDDNGTPENPSDDFILDVPGYDQPGFGIWTPADDIDMASSPYCFPDGKSHYHIRNLVIFSNLDAFAVSGKDVVRATLVLSNTFQHIDGTGDYSGEFYISEVVTNWTPGDVYWTNFGDGGQDAGVLGAVMHASEWRQDEKAATAPGPFIFQLDPTVVQNWVANPSENHGMLLWHPAACWGEPGETYASHWTAHGEADANPPALILEFGTVVPSSVVPMSDVVGVQFNGVAGKTYYLESTTDLPADDWSGPIGTFTPAADGTYLLYDTAGATATKSYRVIEL